MGKAKKTKDKSEESVCDCVFVHTRFFLVVRVCVCVLRNGVVCLRPHTTLNPGS